MVPNVSLNLDLGVHPSDRIPHMYAVYLKPFITYSADVVSLNFKLARFAIILRYSVTQKLRYDVDSSRFVCGTCQYGGK